MKSALLSIVVCLVSHAVTQGRDPFVYVSLAKENRIVTYQMTGDDGKLTLIDSLAVEGGPGALAFHPSRPILFASIRTVGNLASFRIDELTGKLTKINQVSAGADPAYVAVDKSGKYLLSAYYRAAKVLVHAITNEGAIGEELQSISTDERAHAIVSDREGRYWFVPHTRPNAIFQFRLDEETQRLVACDPPKLQREPNSGPRHLWFHPSLDVAYTSDEQGRSVSAYRFDRDKGTLDLRQTLSTLPADYDRRQSGSTSDIEVHPSGRYVYVANRGHDSIARYRVLPKNGMLEKLGNTASEQTTRSFNIDPSGDFLIAAGQESGKLAVFRIDLSNGDLQRVQTVLVGDSPWWVLIR
ncbi:MAG: lactonase family protein [Rubripirellula sp.]|nr:lactonase family protein [Rubripirellula sp.]